MRNLFTSPWLADALCSVERKPTIILLTAPVILITWKYFGSTTFYLHYLGSNQSVLGNAELAAAMYTFFATLLLMGVVPAMILKFSFCERLSQYGLKIGDWKTGLKTLTALGPVIIAIAFNASQMEEFSREYPVNKSAASSELMFVVHAITYLVYYSGWEFYFRGFVQYGLREALGPWNAILVQTLASSLLHIGKPAAETYGAVLGGIVWGLICFRTNSVIWGVLQHWLLGVSLDFFISYL